MGPEPLCRGLADDGDRRSRAGFAGGEVTAAHNRYFEQWEVFRRDKVDGRTEDGSAAGWPYPNRGFSFHGRTRGCGEYLNRGFRRESIQDFVARLLPNYDLDGVSRTEVGIQAMDSVDSPQQ